MHTLLSERPIEGWVDHDPSSFFSLFLTSHKHEGLEAVPDRIGMASRRD
jgi:hypothetical protein